MDGLGPEPDLKHPHETVVDNAERDVTVYSSHHICKRILLKWQRSFWSSMGFLGCKWTEWAAMVLLIFRVIPLAPLNTVVWLSCEYKCSSCACI